VTTDVKLAKPLGVFSPVSPQGLLLEKENMENAKYVVFKTCANGHNLLAPSAHIYRSGGLRECRECAIGKKPGKKGIATTNFSLSHKS
jgi:hypothetical protein